MAKRCGNGCKSFAVCPKLDCYSKRHSHLAEADRGGPDSLNNTTMNIRQQSLKQFSSILRNTILDKIWAGAGYGAIAYIYKVSRVADMELDSPQYLLLALLHSLVTEDVMSCYLIADICHQVQQLQSDYLSVWLTRDFVFLRKEIEKAMALLNNLLETGVLKLPSHVTRIMISLATKYRIHDVQLISSREGHRDSVYHLEEAVVNNSPGDIIAIACEGGDVNGLTGSGESLIHLAARLGTCSSIAALSFLKANLEPLNSNNATPLEESVKNDRVFSVKALLSSGAVVSKRFSRGDTYLHIAAAGGQNRALQALLEEGMDVNMENDWEETPLFQAVLAGNIRGMEILLENGADFNLKDREGRTALHYAAEGDCFRSVTILLDFGALVNEQDNKGDTPAFVAAVNNKPANLKLLVEKGADLALRDRNCNGILHRGACDGLVEIVRVLLDAGAEVNMKGQNQYTALHYAAKEGHTAVVAALIKGGAEVDMKDHCECTPLNCAASKGHTSVVTLLLDAGVNLSMKGLNQTALHAAASEGHTAVVAALLDAGIEIDLGDEWGWTALQYASFYGHPAVVELLLDRGANVEEEGCSSLSFATEKGHLAVVELLVSRGAHW